jgi:cytochrome c oxidase subunit III
MTSETYLAEQFETEAQQREAAQLGVWVFLGTEIMLFSGIFASILIYRVTYWQAAQAATEHLHVALGGINTALLLTSSLTVGFAVLSAREGRTSSTFWWMIATALLGLAFLGVKGYEYLEEYREGLMPGIGPPFPLDAPAAHLFFNLYYAGTGLHALHLGCGVAAVLIFALGIKSGRLVLPTRQMMIEGVGMYWGLVDMIWVFLFSALYLV